MPTPELTPEQLQRLADINKPLGDNPDYGSLSYRPHPEPVTDPEIVLSPEGYPLFSL